MSNEITMHTGWGNVDNIYLEWQDHTGEKITNRLELRWNDEDRNRGFTLFLDGTEYLKVTPMGVTVLPLKSKERWWVCPYCNHRCTLRFDIEDGDTMYYVKCLECSLQGPKDIDKDDAVKVFEKLYLRKESCD